MLRYCLVALVLVRCAATPPYFASVANSVLRTRGGVMLGRLDTAPIMRLEQQVKRVLAADPSLPLNVTQAATLPEEALLKILLLAVLGNFTSSAAASWEQPCSILLDPVDGRFVRADSSSLENSALRVIVLLLMLVEFGRWGQASLRTLAPDDEHSQVQGKAR